MKKTPPNPPQTLLVIVTGFALVALFTARQWPLVIAVSVGLGGLLSARVAYGVHLCWIKLAQLLAAIMPNVLLTVVFWGILTPIAVAWRIFTANNPLSLRNPHDSLFRPREKPFERGDFEKPW
jgi:cytochrome c oxidase subunit IV